ncbi:hypothetical protein [Actinotalea sp. C106]|uniref:hypothetical protein n=1 Tax=Actinotalea sp. C106 TaxID=2908644 RepID=UPI002027DA60|nr:hypothetical protein [Actinotalea sp. C106]
MSIPPVGPAAVYSAQTAPASPALEGASTGEVPAAPPVSSPTAPAPPPAEGAPTSNVGPGDALPGYVTATAGLLGMGVDQVLTALGQGTTLTELFAEHRGSIEVGRTEMSRGTEQGQLVDREV